MAQTLPLPVSALETRLRLLPGTLTGADLNAANLYIQDATALALAEVPAATQVAWQTDLPDTVAIVIYKAARREYENPSSLSQEISGEHTVTTQATSGVYLTALEIAQVRRAAGLNASGFVGSVRVSAPWTPAHWYDEGWESNV